MRDFTALLMELATARSRYEDLRRRNAPLDERLDSRIQLDELRATIGSARRNYAGLI